MRPGLIAWPTVATLWFPSKIGVPGVAFEGGSEGVHRETTQLTLVRAASIDGDVAVLSVWPASVGTQSQSSAEAGAP